MTASPTKKRRAGGRQRSSHTAAKVARGVVFLARDPLHAGLLPQGAAESIERLALEAGVLKPWMCRLFEQPWYRRILVGLTDALWSGELMRLTLRKRFVDDEVRSAIDEGARQLLIVGAGLDTLGLRVAAASPNVMVVDVDTVATADRRRAAIERMGEQRPQHHVVGAELGRTPLREVVDTIFGWDPAERTVVVAEGVVMYLDQAEVVGFLEEIKRNTGPGSRLVFSYLPSDQAGRPDLGILSGLTRASLTVAGEPLRWAVREEGLAPFLERAGYRMLGPRDRFDLRQRYLVPAGIDQPVGQMELFAVAEVAESTGPGPGPPS